MREAPARCSIALLGALIGCASAPGSAAPKPIVTVTASPADDAKRIDFSYADLNGKMVSTESVHGRITIVFFMTTYDVASQAETRFVAEIVRDHTPRLNAIGLDLEALENKPLVDAYANALSLPYPICMADQATIRGEGPFTGLNGVPSVVLLDKNGRERWRHIGLARKPEIEDAIHTLEKSGS